MAIGARPSVLEAEGVVACSLGGLSKSAGLPQVKLGWIAFGGPDARVREVMEAFEVVADTYLSVSTPIQVAAPALIERGGDVRDADQRADQAQSGRPSRGGAGSPSISLLDVEGGWSAVLQVPAYRSEESLVIELLTDDHVLVHPGFFFDFDREAFLVVSLLPEGPLFDRGIERVLARASEPRQLPDAGH